MKCTENQRNTEIINNLKRYFQNNIDKGYSKFVYNDYGLDEKNIDILNALDYFLENNTKQQKEIKELKEDIEEYYKPTLDIFDEREYRKKYLEERRKEEPNLLYPDGDEIYKRYYEQKEIIKELQLNIKDLKSKTQIISPLYIKENYISKDEIRKKIKELNDNRPYLSKFDDWKEKEYTNEDIIDNCVQALEELLGDE